LKRILFSLCLLLIAAITVASQSPVVRKGVLWRIVSGTLETDYPATIDTLSISSLSHSAIPTASTTDTLVCPYKDLSDGAANLGGNGADEREYYFHGQKYRIRQNGTVTQIRMKVTDNNLTGITFAIWRGEPSSATLVGRSNDFVGDVVSGTITTYDITDIEGVQEGDYYGIRFTTSDTGNILSEYTGQTNVDRYRYRNNGGALTGTVDWTAGDQTGAGGVVPIEVYMDNAPQIVFFGDSIPEGAPRHYSFCEATQTTDMDAVMPYYLSTALSATYQNMCIAGEDIEDLAERVAADVVALNPKIAVITDPYNSLKASDDIADTDEYLTHWGTVLDSLRAADIVPVIIQTIPATSASLTGDASADGDGGGTTVIDTDGSLSAQDDYYNGWSLTISNGDAAGEERTVTDYDGGSNTLTVAAYSVQITQTAQYFLTGMRLRDTRKKELANLVAAYPNAILIDSDYTMGQNNTDSGAKTANLWDLKTAYNYDATHLTNTGCSAWGAYLADEIVRLGKW
jgi:hypothetical protein